MKLAIPAATLVAAITLHGGQTAAQPTRVDSARLSRRQAIAEALQHNGQIEAAREQTAQARARRVSGVAIPDPTLTAAYDQETSPLGFGGAGSRPVAVGFTVPFPTKFRINSRIGGADIGASESNLRLQQQSIALQASAS